MLAWARGMFRGVSFIVAWGGGGGAGRQNCGGRVCRFEIVARGVMKFYFEVGGGCQRFLILYSILINFHVLIIIWYWDSTLD